MFLAFSTLRNFQEAVDIDLGLGEGYAVCL